MKHGIHDITTGKDITCVMDGKDIKCIGENINSI